MINKHTPAPWKVDNQNITTADYLIVASLPRQIYERGSVAGENESLEKAVNAKLIAAAPELLEALQAVIDLGILTCDEDGSIVYQQIEAAIKKAKGE